MTTLTLEKDRLITLLRLVQRKQTLNGKSKSQVESCVLHADEEKLSVTSLVKDGVTSVSHFTQSYYHEYHPTSYIIPSIDAFLGVLKYHGKNLTISYNDGKTKITSGKKQTTLATHPNALAYASSPDTIKEWHEKSIAIAVKINPIDGTYFMEDKETPMTGRAYDKNFKKAFFTAHEIDTTDLFEALRCDGMNSQKSGRYTFIVDGYGVHVVTGKDLKGRTKTTISPKLHDGTYHRGFKASFEGGLEETMKLATGDVTLHFLDWREERPGQNGEWGLILSLGDGDFIYQNSVVDK